MKYLLETKNFWRSRLPHWEVKQGIYFITIRSAESLPFQAQKRLEEIKQTLEQQEANSESFKDYQREVFATCEKFLDSGHGFCPFVNPKAATQFISELENWSSEALWLVSNYCVMPNHVHFIAGPLNNESVGLHEYLKRLKGRSARNINKILNRAGSLWQTEWFDRWIRNKAELEKTIRYIRNNPVNAQLAKTAEEYPFSN